MHPRIKNKTELPAGKKTILSQFHTKVYSGDWLTQSIISVNNNNKGEGRGVKRESSFFPLKGRAY